MTIFRLLAEFRETRARYDEQKAYAFTNLHQSIDIAYQRAIGEMACLWLDLDRRMSWLQRWVGWDPRAK